MVSRQNWFTIFPVSKQPLNKREKRRGGKRSDRRAEREERKARGVVTGDWSVERQTPLRDPEERHCERREEEGADPWATAGAHISRALLGKTHVVPDSEWVIQDFGKTHVPGFEWRIQDFSSLLKTGAKSTTSGAFHCSGYNWFLQVSPMHKEASSGTPYVALRLVPSQLSLVPGHTVHAVFALSIYNHSKGIYCGCKATYNFDSKNTYSKEHCLIPLQELLKSSAFLVDDSCVAVEILKIDVSSPEKKSVVVQKKATIVQNLFVQSKGFIKGTYTWTMNNFLELDLKHFAHSPTFEVGGQKWYIGMYPRGDKYSTDCLSLYLYPDVSDELQLESKKVAVMTLSILDQNNGKHFTRTSGLWVCGQAWGWPNFFGLKKLKDPSGGYVVGSSCIVKADLTIVGSSNDD